MQKAKINIVSTRPVGKELTDEALQHDIIIKEISFIKTEALIDNEIEKKIKELTTQNISVVFTSMNAVDAVAGLITSKPSWKIFCIGNTTKNLAEKFFGKKNIEGFADNAAHLSQKIIEKASVKKITFFCGDIRRDELPYNLKENGITVNEVVVYKTVETPASLNHSYDGILFFSPSAVRSFFSKNCIKGITQLFAVGATTASEIKLFTQLPVVIAEKPGKENLVKLAITHFSKSNII